MTKNGNLREHDSQDRGGERVKITRSPEQYSRRDCRKGQQEQDSYIYTDSPNRTAKIGQAEQDRQNRTGREGQTAQDRLNRKYRTEQPEQDSQDNTVGTGPPEQNRQNRCSSES